MSEPIRILMIEDDANDADLTRIALSHSGLSCEFRRVDRRDTFLAALKSFSPQLIISDFGLPQFDGFEALTIARQDCPEVPFIFASGTIGQARADKALSMGAKWYVEKGNYKLLVDYVKRLFKN